MTIGFGEKIIFTAAQHDKKAIVAVSFGTTYAETRKACIESVENRLQAAFPDYDVCRAFTSRIVRKRLAERDNMYVNDLEGVLSRLRQQGYSEVVVQTTHLTPGEEYENKVLAIVAQFTTAFPKLAVGRPLLYYTGEGAQPDDYEIAVKALETQFPLVNPGEAIVLMGHGSPNKPTPVYLLLQQYLTRKGLPGLIGVVEENNEPNFTAVQAELKARNITKVTLMPLLLVAGDHANNDMAGADDESWKSQLLAQGYEVAVYLHGLGENTAIQDIYVQHVRDAIAAMK